MKHLILASWLFMSSTYSNSPPVRPFVEGLPDQRAVTWGYSIKRSWNHEQRTFYHPGSRVYGGW